MQRQAATPSGVDKRLRDLQFNQLVDPRSKPYVRYSLAILASHLVASMVTAARSLRDAERRSLQMSLKLPGWIGNVGRIADNTFGKLIPRLDISGLVKRQHALVKAEQRRGNLKPTLLPFGVAAIDGKNVATLHWPDLCRVLDMDPATAQPKDVKKRLNKEFPLVQFCEPKQGKPYALARVHTVTLISSSAAIGLHQRPIPGCTNEVGALPALLSELNAAYKHTHLIEMITNDAGNTSLATATQIVEKLHLDYFSQFKTEQGDLHAEAERVLGARHHAKADADDTDSQNGCTVTYHAWVHDLSTRGWLKWTHARQFVRVERISENASTGVKTIGNRYYVCSRPTEELTAKQALVISRGHWRCEEETHWTSDVVLREDLRRLSWSRHPQGVFVVAVFRMMALTILAIARKLSRHGYTHETPTWAEVAEHFLLSLCGPTLCTDAFDAVTD